MTHETVIATLLALAAYATAAQSTPVKVKEAKSDTQKR